MRGGVIQGVKIYGVLCFIDSSFAKAAHGVGVMRWPQLLDSLPAVKTGARAWPRGSQVATWPGILNYSEQGPRHTPGGKSNDVMQQISAQLIHNAPRCRYSLPFCQLVPLGNICLRLFR